jgi:ATP-dependent Clp protease adaptor protein ClpS
MLARRAGDLQRTLGRILRSMAKSKMGTRGAARWLAAKNDPPGPGRGEEGRTGIATKTRPKTKKPSLYKVLLLNDDYTPMEFVVYVLEQFFNKSREDATRIMLHVHQHGVGVCGVFTYEVAETKVAQVVDTARRHQHPLQCTMEKD